jgi:quinol monooxygenase YgiN
VYVDVMPASLGKAVAALAQYRNASRQDPGFVRLEMFEQAGWPGRLSIVETWSDQKAMEAHAAATHTKEWRSAIDSIRLSGYDQRPYKFLSAAAPSDVNSRATFVISHVDIGGQGTNAAEILRAHADTSRKEKGNLRFDVMQHAMRANHFTVVEAWQNQAALDAHSAAPHTRQYRDSLNPITGSPLDERIYKVVE